MLSFTMSYFAEEKPGDVSEKDDANAAVPRLLNGLTSDLLEDGTTPNHP